MATHPTLDDILDAQRRIDGVIRHTPMVASLAVPVTLKLENRQETGSFKLRGAANCLLTLTDDQCSRGSESGLDGAAPLAYGVGRP